MHLSLFSIYFELQIQVIKNSPHIWVLECFYSILDSLISVSSVSSFIFFLMFLPSFFKNEFICCCAPGGCIVPCPPSNPTVHRFLYREVNSGLGSASLRIICILLPDCPKSSSSFLASCSLLYFVKLWISLHGVMWGNIGFSVGK